MKTVCECCGQEIVKPASKMFEEFWAVYPSKVGKKKAQAAWKRRKLDAIADMIIDSVRDRIEHDPQWEAGYIQNPTTFINGDLWEDEINTRAVAVKLPTKNEDWMRLGQKHGINPGTGESWVKFKDRVRRAAEAGQ